MSKDAQQTQVPGVLVPVVGPDRARRWYSADATASGPWTRSSR